MVRQPCTVYCVVGPPGAGKSTWVRSQALSTDLVWDLDEMAACMSPAYACRGHRPPHLAFLLLDMRAALIKRIKSGDIPGRVYIIISDLASARKVLSGVFYTVVDFNGYQRGVKIPDACCSGWSEEPPSTEGSIAGGEQVPQ